MERVARGFQTPPRIVGDGFLNDDDEASYFRGSFLEKEPAIVSKLTSQWPARKRWKSWEAFEELYGDLVVNLKHQVVPEHKWARNMKTGRQEDR